MKNAINRTYKSILNHELIGIFGDYDVDGASSTALLTRYFLSINQKIKTYIPDRQSEGYGPNINGFKNLIDNGAKNCIFTMGDEGSVFISKDEYIKTPAFEIDVVDTTGCGDAFDAGMIAAIVKGFDLEKALKFATITSALVATGLGSDAGIKSFEDSLEKMNNLKLK